jgi:hypothetical protein
MSWVTKEVYGDLLQHPQETNMHKSFKEGDRSLW